MKSPEELAGKLAKQWQNADHREARLLTQAAWPIELSIGKPTASEFAQTAQLRQHLQAWRDVKVGNIKWQSISYRAASAPVDVPLIWKLHSPSEWVNAANDRQVQVEYHQFAKLVQALDARFHSLVIRQRHLLSTKPVDEIIQAGELVLQLTPHCAKGKPLRALSLAGIDSKFFERHRHLIIQLLDILHAGIVSELGLETFLDAADEKDHWLLVVPLDDGLLPFQQQRVRSRELINTVLPGTHVLVVENEQCVHQLPRLPGAIAILGAGLNLNWLQADWLGTKHLAYWGDIDTWGLQMLARARHWQPDLTALLMNQQVFEQHNQKAVVEPEPAAVELTQGLTSSEIPLYEHLLASERGRLEQEFLPDGLVKQAVQNWYEAG